MCSRAALIAACLAVGAEALNQIARISGDIEQQRLISVLRAHQSERQAAHAFREVAVISLKEAPLDASVRVKPENRSVLEATRAAGIGAKNDQLRLASLGKVARVIVQDESDNTVLCDVPGVGKVWLPLQALLRKQEPAEVAASLAESGDTPERPTNATTAPPAYSPSWPLQADGQPLYPLDPMLDVDYLYDDDDGHANYLEDYGETPQMVDKALTDFGYQQGEVSAALKELPAQVPAVSEKKAAYRFTAATTTTTATTPEQAQTHASTPPPTAAEPTTATSTTVAITQAPQALLASCATHRDPRQQRPLHLLWEAGPAPWGTPCVFGADARDEGSHCIFDKGAYGSFGWCYTKQDKSEWGSCDQSCPLWGTAKKLESRIDVLTQKVHLALARLNGK